MGHRLQSLHAAIDGWLTAPEPNAAGRLGLFRIAYALFYLWHLSFHFAEHLSGLAAQHHTLTLLIEWARPYTLPPWVLQATESALVSAIVALMVGYHTRLATLAVLVLGSIYEAWYTSIDGEHAPVLLAFHIPLFMFLSGRWGDTHSLDALLRRRAGLSVVNPADASGTYFLPARACLVVLVVLFLSSAAFKVGPGGVWIEDRDLTANFLLDKNVKSARQGLPLNYLAPAIARHRWLAETVHFSVILFEASLILALLGRRLRDLVLSSALIFHAINGVWLGVTFTPVMIVYLMFVDTEKIRQRLMPRRSGTVGRVSVSILIVAMLGVAMAIGMLWNSALSLRSLFNLGGVLNWHTLWYPVLPFILIWWVSSLARLFRPLTPVRADLLCTS
jgi:hypothetical protein